MVVPKKNLTILLLPTILATIALTSCKNDNSDADSQSSSSASGCKDYQFLAETSTTGGSCFRYLVVTEVSAGGLQAFGSTNVTMAFFSAPEGKIDPRAPIKGDTRVCANKRLVVPTTMTKDYHERLSTYIKDGAKAINEDDAMKSELNGWLPGFWEAFQKVIGGAAATNLSSSNIGLILSVSPMGLRNNVGSYEVWPAALVPEHDCYLLLNSMKAPPYPGVIKLKSPLSY